MPKVLIVHPWLPKYRMPFFRHLQQRLATDGTELSVAVGEPSKDIRARRDSGVEGWIDQLPSREIDFLGRSIVFRSLPSREPFDLVILEQAIGNMENYAALVRPQGARIAFWGHGKTYTHPVTGLESYLKTWITNHADWFFAYTSGGAEYVGAHGFPRERTTIVQNAVDTVELHIGMRGMAAGDRADLLARLGVDADAEVGLFVGGLDPAKRISFLLDAAAEVAERRRKFVLVVAGEGSDKQNVLERAGEPWLRYVGQARNEELGRLATIAKVMLCPGRVGLNAVDSFALSLPLVTTQWPYHAPEFEYLHSGNSLISPNSLEAYVRAVEGLLDDSDLRARLVSGCVQSGLKYTLDNMVARFADGVGSCLAETRRR